MRRAPMSAMPNPAQSELYAGLLPVEPLAEPPPVRPTTLENAPPQSRQPSLRKRASRAFTRYLIAFFAPAAPSFDQQQLNAISLDLDAVRQGIDKIAAGIAAIQERSADRIATEQIARSVAQLTAGQEQMTREITKLQAVEQYVLYKNSEPSPRPAPAPARNPVPRPSQAPMVR